MNEIGLAIIPIGFIVVAVLAYVSVKRNWKLGDIF